MCGQMPLLRKHSRERNKSARVLRTHGNQLEARGKPVGVELHSRADGCYLPEHLRVRVHCRWRVTPSRFLTFITEHTHSSASRALESFLSQTRHKNGSRASIWHHVERPNIVLCCICTNRPARKKKTVVCLARTSSRGLYFRAYWDFARFFWGE